MVFYFDKVINETEKAACFATLRDHEIVLRSAYSRLLLMHQNHGKPEFHTYKQRFMDQCANAACSNAAKAFMAVIDGDPSFLQCDIMNILYKGNPSGDYWQGVPDQVMSKGGYIMTLVNVGIIIDSAFTTI